MVFFPPITVRQPRPHDIVDDPVGVCGVGTGFEGVFSARVRDNNGRELREIPVRAGGAGIWGNFQVEIDLTVRPPHGARHARGLRGGPGRERARVEQGRRPDSLRSGPDRPVQRFRAVHGRTRGHALEHRGAVPRRRRQEPCDLPGESRPDRRPRPHLPGADPARPAVVGGLASVEG
jgi:hypothetical protein